MNGLEKSRQDINRIDTEMARLFEERMNAAKDIADFKKEHGLSISDPVREAELIERNRTLIGDADIEAQYVLFLQNLMKLSCGYQSRRINGLTVAYCGAEGAFAYTAAKRMFPEATLAAFTEFADAYKSVESGENDCVVLPIENSYAGEVGTVMDLVFSGSLFVNQVKGIDITHSLIACEGAAIQTIKTVVSHPQALFQCERYIAGHGFRTETYSNTALAAKYVKELGDPSVAAVASDETALLFGLKILDRHINDSKNNTTRFAAFSRSRSNPVAAQKRDNENFMLVFTVRNEAGALAQTLNIIGSHGYNMRNLRSRPMKDLPWNYYFFIEAEGCVNCENGRNMMRELSAVCAKLRLAGTYFADNV